MKSRLPPLPSTTHGVKGQGTESCWLLQSSSSIGPHVVPTKRHPHTVEFSGSPRSSEREEHSPCATEGRKRPL